jgi:hypothetical protein
VPSHRFRNLLTLIVASGVLSACVPMALSPARQAAALDACQMARSINAPIPNPSAGSPAISSSSQDDFILDALEYLLRNDSDFFPRRPPRRPLATFSIPKRDWIAPPADVIEQRQDSIRVAVTRSGDRRLKRSLESGNADLVQECRRQGLVS